ncbi:unnamed protein product, partial [Ixodes hexagonus]
GASWADEELEYASSLGGEDDIGVDPGASPQQPGPRKRNLAALARSGRLPRFHYHKKLGPGSRGGGGGALLPGRLAMAAQQAHRQDQGWMGDQAFPGDVPDKIGVVEALGRLSEAAIFPYIGPHRWGPPVRRCFVSSPRKADPEYNRSKIRVNTNSAKNRNNVAAKRNGLDVTPNGTRVILYVTIDGRSSPFLGMFSYQRKRTASRCNRSETSRRMKVRWLPPSSRSLASMRLWRPSAHARAVWRSTCSPATSPWPQARSKRQARRCRPNEEAKRNVAAMARKGALPRS